MKNEILILNVIIGGFGGLILSTITTIIYYLLIVRPKKKNKEPSKEIHPKIIFELSALLFSFFIFKQL